MNEDFLDLLRALVQKEARFLVVGAHAMAVHGVPRATGDMDLWVKPDPVDAQRVWDALIDFGAPVQALGVSWQDLETPGRVIQIGLPPRRIDVMTEISGLEFEEAWARRVMHAVGPLAIPFLSREDLVRNKRASGRAKDLADLHVLERRQP